MSPVRHVCLIDDDSVYSFLMQRMIEQTQMVEKVDIFSNGLAALKFLIEHAARPEKLPGAILLDLNMPVMDGWEFLDEFASLKPQLKKRIDIFIVTSSSAPLDVHRARSIEEVTDFLIKPITREMLINVLKEIKN